MKKSEIYHLAQIATVLSPAISPERKLEIIRVLMDDEGIAKYVESKEEREAAVDAE